MGRKMKLDFTGVESFQRASEGVHICKIVSADEKTSQAGNDMITVAFEVIKGDDKGARVYENYPLIDTALWKLKGLLVAIGMKADGKVQLDLDKLIGKTLSVTVKHEEYEGKTRARVDSVSKFSAAIADEDSDDVDEVEEEEEEQEEEEKPKKSEKTKATSKKPIMPEPEDSDDDTEEDDDDWEEEEKPKKKSKPEPKAEKKPEKKAAKKKSDDDDDDWDDGDWDEA